MEMPESRKSTWTIPGKFQIGWRALVLKCLTDREYFCCLVLEFRAMRGMPMVRSHNAVTEDEGEVRPGSEEVRMQLDRLLASPLFRHSKHYPRLLRYVVQETLEGHESRLKERALGMEVFGRSANYDTNADPVVRTTACEVRKRIARYYRQPGCEREILINLLPGSYIPEFRYPPANSRPLTLIEAPPPAAIPDPPREERRMNAPLLTIAVFLAAALAVSAAVWSRPAPAAIERFWSPVWGAAQSAMLAVGSPAADPYLPSPDDRDPTFGDIMRADNLAFADALTMARITGVARQCGRRLEVRRATAYTLTDLREGSLVLVGSFDNHWTMRLTKDLRFYYQQRGDHKGLICDRQNPSGQSWLHDPSVPYSKLNQDYAIVSRFVDPLTERTVVAVGGMGRDGTLAAGEFVTEPRYLETMANRAPKNWETKNLQVVLVTDIVRGHAGPPRILATYFW
jgi:hypothetical protein